MHNIRETIETYLEEEDDPCATPLLHRLNYECGARCAQSDVAKTVAPLISQVHGLVRCLEMLDTALDVAEEYGYRWPRNDRYIDDPPTRGDSVWEAHLRPYIDEFVRDYRRNATFMTRTGQRSQRVCHAELNSWSGLTAAQEGERSHRRWMERRRREEEMERVRIQANADEDRIRQLEVELDQLRKKQARVS